MTIEQAHELLISYGFDCFRFDECWYYDLNTLFKSGDCIIIYPLDNVIKFNDLHVCKNNESFYILSHGKFFSSGLEEIDKDYLKMVIEEYLLKYKKKLVEIEKLELEEEFNGVI